MRRASVIAVIIVAAGVLAGVSAQAAVVSKEMLQVKSQIKPVQPAVRIQPSPEAPAQKTVSPVQQQRLMQGPIRQERAVTGIPRMDMQAQALRIRAKTAPPFVSAVKAMSPAARATFNQNKTVVLDAAGNIVSADIFRASITDVFYGRGAEGKLGVVGVGAVGVGKVG